MPKVWNMRDPKRPPEAVYCGRPTKFGNPFSHKESTLAMHKVATVREAVEEYRKWLYSQPELVEAARSELAGRDLLCWCVGFNGRAGHECHADVLLQVANNLFIDEAS